MKITKHLTIDMVSSGVPAVVDVMQGDEMTRQVSVSLYDAGRPWEPPESVEASVSFRKPDNVSGWYDTMPDGSAACTIAGNLVTAQLVPEITQISGLVSANIIFRNADLLQVGSFPFVIRVIPSPAAGVQKSNPYYKVSSLEQLNKVLDGKVDKAQIAPMIVTLDAESGFASNRPLEMKVYAEAGGNVYLNTGETLIPLDATNDDDLAVFTWIGDDESVIRRWSISDDCSCWYSELPIGGSSAEGAVLYTEQKLTEEQKAQARANIMSVAKDAAGMILEGITKHDVVYFSVGHNVDEYGSVFNYVSLLGDSDRTVRLIRLSDGINNWDAATVGQLKAAVGDISTALDSIIAMQEELIGGESE